jgi:hypothetical protein
MLTVESEGERRSQSCEDSIFQVDSLHEPDHRETLMEVAILLQCHSPASQRAIVKEQSDQSCCTLHSNDMNNPNGLSSSHFQVLNSKEPSCTTHSLPLTPLCAFDIVDRQFQQSMV